MKINENVSYKRKNLYIFNEYIWVCVTDIVWRTSVSHHSSRSLIERSIYNIYVCNVYVVPMCISWEQSLNERLMSVLPRMLFLMCCTKEVCACRASKNWRKNERQIDRVNFCYDHYVALRRSIADQFAIFFSPNDEWRTICSGTERALAKKDEWMVTNWNLQQQKSICHSRDHVY